MPRDDRDGVEDARRRARGRSPTWLKLWMTTITLNLGGFLVATWTSRIIRAGATPAAETSWLAAYYVAMGISALAIALLIDELAFKGAFRRTHIQGRGSKLPQRDGDIEDVAATLQRTNMTFPFVLLISGALTYNLFNLVNGDFDVYQRRIGRHVSKLRHGAPPERIEAIRELSIRRDPAILPALRSALNAEDDVAVWAAWALGRFGDHPTLKPMVQPLWEATRASNPALRSEALLSLGRLQERRIAPELAREVRARRAAGIAIDPRFFYAFGSVQKMSSVPVLEELLHAGTVEEQRLAAWALAQHRDERGGRELVDILEGRLTTAGFEVRCAIVHALGILSDERSNVALVAAHANASTIERTTVCPSVQLSLRPDRELDDRYEVFVPQETYVMKLLLSMGTMRATRPEIREVVEPWLEGRSQDPDEMPAVREASASLLRGIREGRDDSKMRTVEQALGLP